MYENLTYEIILQRMLNRVPNNIDKREGSVIYDALAPAAVELKLLYIELDNMINESFADTATREFLIRRCTERAIVPYPATYAILQGEFTPNIIDVTEQRFRMPNSAITYIVKEIISDGIYKVECEFLGSEGNQYLGRIIPIGFIEGLQTAELTNILIPARNEEETELLRRRYFNSFDSQAFGGNKKDYQEKMNSINGVGQNATKVTPVWAGGGTVKLTFLDAQYNPATSVLIDAVQEMIDPKPQGQGLGLAPIGHTVTIDTAKIIVVDIETNIIFESGASWVSLQSQIINLLQDYMLELRMLWANEDYTVVRTSQIDTKILSVLGIIDVQNTKLNGIASNLTLEKYEIPVFGNIMI